MSWRTLLVSFLAGVGLPAQEVCMASGDVLAGKVVSVARNRAKVQLADGSMRQVEVRMLDCEWLADGTRKWYAAELVDGAMPPPVQTLLARLRKGEALIPPELVQLTENCSAELAKELTGLITSKLAPVRAQAVRALATAATKETMRAALDAALADTTGSLWREVVPSLGTGACLGAVRALDACADLEKALTHKDKAVRVACAWSAVMLGSTVAMPVLVAFVGDSDHHVRESAAMCLAEVGNDAGAKVLLTICTRERSPAMEANRAADADTKQMLARGAKRERIRACELLAKLKHAPALATLRALAGNPDADVAAAAKKAVAALEAK